MPSPIIHTAVAAASAQTARPKANPLRSFLLLAFAANAADLDVVPELLWRAPGRFHHGPTHSLVTALLAALFLAAIPWGGENGYRKRLRWLCVATLSHVGLDLLTADRPDLTWLRDPGIPVFWPLSSSRFTCLFPVFHGSITPHSLKASLDAVAVRQLVIETVAAVVVVGAVRLAARREEPRGASPGLAAADASR